MTRFKLHHVAKCHQESDEWSNLDYGVNAGGEINRLVGDLLILTRPNLETESEIVYADVEALISEGHALISAAAKNMAGELGLSKGPDGKLAWRSWPSHMPSAGSAGSAQSYRRPTETEVICLESESRLLYDATGELKLNPSKRVRLLAAWGVFCCERGLEAIRTGRTIEMLHLFAGAGVLLGHSNYYVGCLTASGLDKLRRVGNGRAGGLVAAAHWGNVAAKAVSLAKEKKLDDGSRSADAVASIIEQEVTAYARTLGRGFSSDAPQRKIAEYLRAAGIRKRRTR